MSEKPYLTLAKYIPPEWDSKRVGLYLTSLTADLGLIPHKDPAHGPIHWKGGSWFSEPLHAEVRRRTSFKKEAESWHQDGDTTPGAKMDCALALWASNTPTEFRWNGTIWRPGRWELVLVRNLLVKHRRPPLAPLVRWVFRQRVEVPKHLPLP